MMASLVACALVVTIAGQPIPPEVAGSPWPRHVIDNTSRGADGTRLADANGDGRPDIATPWEEGGCVRVYLNPGPPKVKDAWPAVTVGQVRSPEDAVLVDLDADGVMEVVSATEGDMKTVFIHRLANGAEWLRPEAWRTEALPASRGRTRWMFCVPAQLDGKHGVDLIVGSKHPDGQIGWFEAPADPCALEQWRYHRLWRASWIMSIVAYDMDRDGDPDILATDRKDPERRGCLWLENPGPGSRQADPWTCHRIGAHDHEVMFLAWRALENEAGVEILVATLDNGLVRLSRAAEGGWREETIPLPAHAGTGKGIAMGDIDLDGRSDIVFSCEHAKDKHGVVWMRDSGKEGWTPRTVSGLEGTKFDLLQLHDLDADGDLDVITCEETENLGVIWYENPAR